MDYTPKRPTPIGWIKQIISPRETEPTIERPGEIYSEGRSELPALIARLSVGIVAIGAYRLPWLFVCILAIIYWCVHGLSRTFARYMDHGSRRLALSMSLTVWALILWQVVTLGGQAAIEVVYLSKKGEEMGYTAQKVAYPTELENFWKDERSRESAWKEREAARTEREKARRAANLEATRQTRTLLALSRENKGAKINVSVSAGEGNPETPEVFITRLPPAPPVPPADGADAFMARWAFRLKVWQLVEFGVGVVGLLLLLVFRLPVNARGQLVVSPEDRALLPLVNGDRDTLSNLPSWRSPSLPIVVNEESVFVTIHEDQESGEEVKFREPAREGLEAPCPVESLPETPLSLPNSTSYLAEFEQWLGNISYQANKLQQGATISPLMQAEISAIIAQKIKENAFWQYISNAANKLDIRESAEILSAPCNVNPFPETEIQGADKGIFEICAGDYKLKQKRKDGKPAGFDIRDREDNYTGYIGQKAGEVLKSGSEEEQRAQVQRIKNKRLGIPTLPRAVNEQ